MLNNIIIPFRRWWAPDTDAARAITAIANAHAAVLDATERTRQATVCALALREIATRMGAEHAITLAQEACHHADKAGAKTAQAHNLTAKLTPNIWRPIRDTEIAAQRVGGKVHEAHALSAAAMRLVAKANTLLAAQAAAEGEDNG